ncbi:ParB/RepB/Spo0J family partition protein [Nocardioides sp. InS609-2]|uniref:ParB/RepB/Spo0J family partition protein n=1 Tax=Nocardioides sp. InS609-2 TaxID=2760705 RepID=UPI0020BFB54D|nr:ParB/RepB/Spo0J family partition protein [Nocardioides sp. InS609-2]
MLSVAATSGVARPRRHEDQKAAKSTSKVPRQSIRHVPVEQLVNHPANVRDDLGDLTEMAQSIREHGILQPLTATELPGTGQLILLAGHRRLAASLLAGMKTVPVIIRHEVTELSDHIVLMLVENTQRLNLNPMERAEAYGALLHSGLSSAEIARRTGTKQATVSTYLNLLMLDEEEREEVRRGVRPVTSSIQKIRAQKQAERTVAEKRPVGRPKGAKTKPWFGDTHPLASQARALCGHRGSPKVGAVACGPCWEQAIRDDIGKTAIAAPPVRAVADDSAVERILGGDWKAKCSPSDKAEVCRRWHAAGKSLNKLAALTGWRPSRYYVALESASVA